MNRLEFLNKLESLLMDISSDDRKEFMFDYNEHFEIGLADGRSEEEIIKSLGDPRTIAKEIKLSVMINKAEERMSVGNIFRAVFASLGLGLFNLIFILGPFIGVASVLFALVVTGGAFTFSGVVMFFGTFLEPVFPNNISIPFHPVVSVFISIGFTALGLLWTIFSIKLTKLFYELTIKYLKMNINIITDRRG